MIDSYYARNRSDVEAIVDRGVYWKVYSVMCHTDSME